MKILRLLAHVGAALLPFVALWSAYRVALHVWISATPDRSAADASHIAGWFFVFVAAAALWLGCLVVLWRSRSRR